MKDRKLIVITNKNWYKMNYVTYISNYYYVNKESVCTWNKKGMRFQVQ